MHSETAQTVLAVCAIISLLGLFYGFCYRQFFRNRNGREKMVALLSNNRPLSIYHKLILSVLAKVGLFFGQGPGFQSYNRILAIALIYPIVFFLITYSVSGENSLGNLEVLPAGGWGMRIGIVLILLGSGGVASFLVLENERIAKNLYQRINIKNPFIRNLLEIIIIFVVSAIFVVVFGDFVFDSDAARIVGGVGIIVVVGVVGVGVDSVFILANGVVIGIFLGVIAVVGGGSVIPPEVYVAWFFYVVLPFANSILDFLSFEVSRKLTKLSSRQENKMQIIGIFIIDFVVALVLLVGMAFVLILFVELYNWAGSLWVDGFSRIDWREMAAVARELPFTRGLTVTLMLISTLFWTAVHAVIMVGSMFFAPVGRRLVLKTLQRGDTPFENNLGALWLVINLLLSVVLVVLVFYGIIYGIMHWPVADPLYKLVMALHPM